MFDIYIESGMELCRAVSLGPVNRETEENRSLWTGSPAGVTEITAGRYEVSQRDKENEH